MADTRENKGFFSKVLGGSRSKSSCCAVELEAVPEAEIKPAKKHLEEKAVGKKDTPNAEQPI